MEQAKAEEIHAFTGLYMDWKGVINPGRGHLPRIYDRVFITIQVLFNFICILSGRQSR